MQANLLPYEFNPKLPMLLMPVEVVYEGKRVTQHRAYKVILYAYRILGEYQALFKKRQHPKQTVGDTFSTVTDADGYVEWDMMVKSGRVPDREAAVLMMRERLALADRIKQPTVTDDPIRQDLQRYRNLYQSARDDRARATVLANVIAAIVSR